MAKCLEMLMVWVLCWFPELPHSAAHFYLFSELGFITLFTDPPWVVPACSTSLPNRVDLGDFAILVHHSVNLFIGFSTMLSWRFLECMHRVSSCSQDSSHFLSCFIIWWQISKPCSQGRCHCTEAQILLVKLSYQLLFNTISYVYLFGHPFRDI